MTIKNGIQLFISFTRKKSAKRPMKYQPFLSHHLVYPTLNPFVWWQYKWQDQKRWFPQEPSGAKRMEKVLRIEWCKSIHTLLFQGNVNINVIDKIKQWILSKQHTKNGFFIPSLSTNTGEKKLVLYQAAIAELLLNIWDS